MTTSTEQPIGTATAALPADDASRGGLPGRPVWLSDRVLSGTRWVAVAVWLALLVTECVLGGVPYEREEVLLWIAAGAAAVSIGKRSIGTVVVDFLPFAAILVAWDFLRGAADNLGMPTAWTPQIRLDRVFGFGQEPTIWLQEHLKTHATSWYDIVVSFTYCTFFLVPYLTAGVLWVRRGRAEYWRWAVRYCSLALSAYVVFALAPTAPPWAAARCTAQDVAGGPNDPACMNLHQYVANNLLGSYDTGRAGALHRVTRTVWRGFDSLHLHLAHSLWSKGAATADPVAAVPSLHCGSAALLAIFLWSRVRRRWRPLLVAYPLLMAFSLVYSGEHYVTDCVAAALLAVLANLAAPRIERWWRERRGKARQPPRYP